MSDLTLFLIKVGYLVLLWLFVLIVAVAMRKDLMPRRRRAPTPAPRPATQPPVVASPSAGPPAAAAPVKPKRGQPRRLVITAGSLEGTTVDLTGVPITLGRASDNTLVLDDDYASAHHARLRPFDAGWIVEDLGSTNGTYVEKGKITAPTPIATGVPVRIGKTSLELRK